MNQNDRNEGELKRYLELTPQAIRDDLRAIQARSVRPPGQRQEPFNVVEVLLCYGLFELVDPHRYGGRNQDKMPEVVKTLAAFFRRPATSITFKMLNLDGSQKHGQPSEPLLYATLAEQPEHYIHLYLEILQIARDMGLDGETVPDFLRALDKYAKRVELQGQYELPASPHHLLREARAQFELDRVKQELNLDDRLTEKLVERKVRLLQNYFARDVLHNCGNTCVFCGFAPRNLGEQNGLLHASHIKPWAASDARERIDVRNGLAACPMHDAAFDYGYLTIEDTHSIIKAKLLQESIVKDLRVRPYFDDLLSKQLILPVSAKKPAPLYLEFHRLNIFRR